MSRCWCICKLPWAANKNIRCIIPCHGADRYHIRNLFQIFCSEFHSQGSNIIIQIFYLSCPCKETARRVHYALVFNVLSVLMNSIVADYMTRVWLGRRAAHTRDRYNTIALTKNPRKGELRRGASTLFGQLLYFSVKDFVFLQVVSLKARKPSLINRLISQIAYHHNYTTRVGNKLPAWKK